MATFASDSIKKSVTLHKDILIKDFSQGSVLPNSVIFYYNDSEPFCKVSVNPVCRSNPEFVSVRVRRCSFYPRFFPGVIYHTLGWTVSVVDAEGAEKFVSYFGHEDFHSLNWMIDFFSDRGYELEEFVRRSVLLEDPERILPGGVLTVRVQMFYECPVADEGDMETRGEEIQAFVVKPFLEQQAVLAEKKQGYVQTNSNSIAVESKEKNVDSIAVESKEKNVDSNAQESKEKNVDSNAQESKEKNVDSNAGESKEENVDYNAQESKKLTKLESAFQDNIYIAISDEASSKTDPEASGSDNELWYFTIETSDQKRFEIPFGTGTTTLGSLLRSASPVFDRMLETPMVEKSKRFLKMDDIESSTFSRFLSYLENGKVDVDASLQECGELYRLAHTYQAQKLELDSVKKIAEIMDHTKTEDVAKFSKFYGDDTLMSKVEAFRFRPRATMAVWGLTDDVAVAPLSPETTWAKSVKDLPVVEKAIEAVQPKQKWGFNVRYEPAPYETRLPKSLSIPDMWELIGDVQPLQKKSNTKWNQLQQ